MSDDLGPGWAMRKMNEYAIDYLRKASGSIPASTRAEWRSDSRPTNHDSAREAILNRRIIQLLDALDAAERCEEPDAVAAAFDGFLVHIETDPLCSQYREPTTPAKRARFDAARGIVCPACAAAVTSDKAWADGYNHAKGEMLSASECTTCSGRGVWMDEPCGDCATSGCRCYGCNMDDHNDPRQGGGCTNCGDCEGWL